MNAGSRNERSFGYDLSLLNKVGLSHLDLSAQQYSLIQLFFVDVLASSSEAESSLK